VTYPGHPSPPKLWARLVEAAPWSIRRGRHRHPGRRAGSAPAPGRGPASRAGSATSGARPRRSPGPMSAAASWVGDDTPSAPAANHRGPATHVTPSLNEHRSHD